MTLTTSYNSKTHQFMGIYKWSLRKNMASAIVYTVFLLFSFPMLLTLYRLIVGVQQPDGIEYTLDNFAKVVFPLVTGGISMLFTLMIAVFMFSYLHKKRSVDVFGALPVTRRTLFFSRYFTGLTILLVPYLLCMGISAVLCMPYTAVIEQLLLSSVNVITAMVVSYTFTAFIAVCCGTTADMIISVLAINGLYPVVIAMCQLMGNNVLPGVLSNINPPSVVYTAFSPYASGLVNAMFDYRLENSGIQFLWWFVLMALCVAGCMVCSRKRKAESAQSGFAFKLPPILIRAIACTASGLLFAFLFNAVSSGASPGNSVFNSHVWFFAGLLIGSFIGHLVLTFIYNRGVKGFLKSLIPYGILVLVIGACYAVLSTGVFGMDIYVPEAEQVKKVEFTVNGSTWLDPVLEKRLCAVYTEQEDIQKVIAIHQGVTEDLREKVGYPYKLNFNRYGVMDEDTPFDYVSVRYTMESGATVERFYNNSMFNSEKIADEVLAVTSTNDYKDQAVEPFKLDDQIISNIYTYANGTITVDGKELPQSEFGAYNTTVTDKEQIREIMEAVRRDILEDPAFYTMDKSRSYDQEQIPYIQLEVLYDIKQEEVGRKEGTMYTTYGAQVTVTPSYKHAWAVLGRYGLRPLDAAELANATGDMAKELYSVPEVKQTDTYAYTAMTPQEKEAIEQGNTGGEDIFFEVPDNWNKKEVYCRAMGQGEDAKTLDVKFGALDKCKKAEDGRVKFVLPDLYDNENDSFYFTAIQFYDKDGNSTQKISLDQRGESDTVRQTREVKADTGKIYGLFEWA